MAPSFPVTDVPHLQQIVWQTSKHYIETTTREDIPKTDLNGSKAYEDHFHDHSSQSASRMWLFKLALKSNLNSHIYVAGRYIWYLDENTSTIEAYDALGGAGLS